MDEEALAPTRSLRVVRSDTKGRAFAAVAGFLTGFFLSAMWFGLEAPAEAAATRSPSTPARTIEGVVIREATTKRAREAKPPPPKHRAARHAPKGNVLDRGL